MLGCRSVKSFMCHRPIHTHKISRSWIKRQQWIIFLSERTKLQVGELYNLVPMKTNLDSAAYNNIEVHSRFLWQLWGLSFSKIKMLPCTKPDDCDVIHWQKEGLFFIFCNKQPMRCILQSFVSIVKCISLYISCLYVLNVSS